MIAEALHLRREGMSAKPRIASATWIEYPNDTALPPMTAFSFERASSKATTILSVRRKPLSDVEEGEEGEEADDDSLSDQKVQAAYRYNQQLDPGQSMYEIRFEKNGEVGALPGDLFIVNEGFTCSTIFVI
ncbi:hypothetical protein DL93DRAFT_2086066, partial [Clavulina sp. PMI_390]